MIADELSGLVAYLGTVSGRVAERHSAQVYVRVSVNSNDVEETCERVA